MMNINLDVGSHATGYPSKVLAQNYGAHTFNVKLTSNTDNGNLIAIGDWDSLDVYTEKAVTTFEGKIVAQMSNGDWLVDVIDAGDACLVYEDPISPYEHPSLLKNEKSLYNKTGDIVRSYKLTDRDNFQVNTAAFDGTPAVGKEIKAVTSKKLVISA